MNKIIQNKKKIIGGFLVVVLIGIGFALGATRSQTNAEVQTVAVEDRVNTTENIYYVALNEKNAIPAELLIKRGEFVQFNSNDGKSHDISTGKGNDYGREHDHEGTTQSGPFGADEGYKVQFNLIGTYYFHDHNNPDITITVAVYDPNLQ